MSIETFIAVAGFVLGVGGTLTAVVNYYASSQTKKYAAQRDFEHLRRNQEQLIHNISEIAKDIDEVREEVRNMSRVAQIILAKRGDSESELLGRKD